MMNKNCPWCQSKIDILGLLLLDEHAPRKCKNCGKYLKTPLVSSLVSVVIPITMFAAALTLFDLDLLISLSLLLLIPVLRIALAEPLKYSLISTGIACLKCKRTNIGFSFPNSNICDKCLLAQKQSNSQISLHQKHQSKPPSRR